MNTEKRRTMYLLPVDGST